MHYTQDRFDVKFRWIIAFFVGAFIVAFVLAFITGLIFEIDPRATIETQFILFYVVLFFYIRRVLRRSNMSFQDIFRPIPNEYARTTFWSHVLGAVIVKLGISMVNGAISIGFFGDELADADSTLGDMNFLLAWFSILVIAPFFEEIFCRGMIFSRSREKWGIRVGIIVSSAIFSVLHGSNFFGHFFSGLVFALIYLKAQTLYAPIIAHFINNLIAGVLMLISSMPIFEGVTFSAEALLVVLTLGGVVCIIVGWRMVRSLFRQMWPQKNTQVNTSLV